MAYENKPNTGVLFKNDRKTTENHPDLTGTFYDEDGNERWLSAWKNTSRGGKQYVSIVVGDVKEQQFSRSRPEPDDFDKDIPF